MKLRTLLTSVGLLATALVLIAATGVSPVQTFSCSANQFVNSLAATGQFGCGAPATTFGAVKGTERTVSGTTDTLSASDCGTTIVYTSGSAVTVTTVASIVSGTDTCSIAIYQKGTAQVSIQDGAGATHVSAHTFTKTFGQYAILGLFIQGGSASEYVITGDGA